MVASLRTIARALLLALAAAPLADARRVLSVSHGSVAANGTRSHDGNDTATQKCNGTKCLGGVMKYFSGATGDCAFHDLDNWKPPTDSKCSIYVYRCSTTSKGQLDNHNVGDVGWALSSECHSYGDLLHIYKIYVARSWMYQQPCWDGGVLGWCKGGYTQCNHNVCGCGMSGNDCGEDPGRNKKDANHFGWRKVPDALHPNIPALGWDLSTCPCHHFSLPKRAEGRVDDERTKEFIAEKQYEDRSIDAKFQWRRSGGIKVVKVEDCIKKHVLTAGSTLEEKLKAFQSAVLEGGLADGDCEDVTHHGPKRRHTT